jgi:hypothetical protein
VETIIDEIKPPSIAEEPTSPQGLPTKAPTSITKDNLWPLFVFEMKNRIVLDSAVSIIFDTLDTTYDEDTKVASSNSVCLAT